MSDLKSIAPKNRLMPIGCCHFSLSRQLRKLGKTPARPLIFWISFRGRGSVRDCSGNFSGCSPPAQSQGLQRADQARSVLGTGEPRMHEVKQITDLCGSQCSVSRRAPMLSGPKQARRLSLSQTGAADVGDAQDAVNHDHGTLLPSHTIISSGNQCVVRITKAAGRSANTSIIFDIFPRST